MVKLIFFLVYITTSGFAPSLESRGFAPRGNELDLINPILDLKRKSKFLYNYVEKKLAYYIHTKKYWKSLMEGA